MDPKGFHRKLAAILSADVAGYSRLMQADVAATVKTLEAYKQIISDLVKQHRGRVVDSPGDNLLIEFPSVVDAVQKELQTHNAKLPESRRMLFRIGVNLGDVIEEDERIYGDGVNIAARLESLADPGGICISKTAFNQIETKLPFGYEFLGEQPVKNSARPVGAYKVLMEPRVTKGNGARYTVQGSRRRILIIGLAGEGDRVRISAQLIDTATGSHVFSERYDRKFADVFALQDEITLKILVALQIKLTEGERALALVKGTQNLDAYMKVMQARAYANHFTPEANTLARQAAEEALELDPNYPMAYLWLSATYLMELAYGSGEPSAGTLRKADELVQKALKLDENLAEGHAFMGRIYLARWQHDSAVKRGERAAALAPNSDFALAALAFTLRYYGKPEEAIGLYRKAMRLNPLPPIVNKSSYRIHLKRLGGSE